MLELRTPKQIERDKRDASIAAYFQSIKSNHPDVSNMRAIQAIADEGRFGIHSFLAVRAALLRQGAIEKRV